MGFRCGRERSARVVIRSLCLAAILNLCVTAALAVCQPDVIDIRQNGSEVRFQVEVVDTPESRAQGLMFRKEMAQFSGMLFVYDQPQRVAFWMKNTLIPLDMVFAGADGVVRRVHANAIPGDLTSIPGGDDIQFVLEINGGLAATLGLSAGAELRHPAIANGAWPC